MCWFCSSPHLYPFYHLKPEVCVLLGFRKCLAYFVRQPQRNFFLWNFIYCLRSVEFVEFELDFVLHELSQQQNVSCFSYSEIYDLLLRLYQSHWLIILLLFFCPSRLYFSSPSSFCRRREFLPKTACVKRNVMYLCWISPRVSWNCVESYWVWWHNL